MFKILYCLSLVGTRATLKGARGKRYNSKKTTKNTTAKRIRESIQPFWENVLSGVRKRPQPIVSFRIWDEKCGFCPGHKTMNQWIRLRGSRESGCPAQMCFAASHKAFLWG